MPTVLRAGPYRFVFFSSDRSEPAHIHVVRDTAVAKFWLSPISLAHNRGFPDHDLTSIAALVVTHREKLQEAWDAYFGT